MVMVKIGDSIINENAFIEIKLRLKKYDTEATYIFQAYWYDGEEVCSAAVHTFTVPIAETEKTMKDKVDAEFKVAYNNIKWNEFSTGS